MYEPKRFPLIPFVIGIIVVLAGVGVYFRMSRTPQPEPTVVAATQVQPTATIRPTATLSPTNTPTPMPTTTPAPDIRFGVVVREDGCEMFNEIISEILQGQAIRVSTIEFPDADSLYEALADRRVDLTLCFQDPADRSYLTQHVGFLKTLGAPYFEADGLRLQVMLNAANVVPLREEKPCLVQLLQMMTFEESIDGSANNWLRDNKAVVDDWTDCG